nr:CDP-glycerol glycerophosphotransferase family protein [Nocardioides aequoreus]
MRRRAKPTIMFESWRGSYADSPRAVSEVLGQRARRVWVGADAAAFPDDVRTVRRHSPAYFAHLYGSRALVANDIITKHLVKGPRLFYVQAWHGTPLKLLGHDERSPAYGVEEHVRRMDRDVAKWDALISSSPDCTALLRSAFRYDGEVWETGYPRNDVLRSAGAPSIRTRVRDALGLREDDFVLLHAPTWRDDQRDDTGGFAPAVGIRTQGLRDVGRRIVVLDRQHHNVRRARVAGDGVIDVSRHPEVAELYLAADALVTDYSSAVFDFVVTGKPVLFFVPDLAAYEEVRGFYFDYHEWAPGPVVTGQDELAAAVEQLVVRGVSASDQTRYDQFVARWCPCEDGHAGDRVVERLCSVLDC